MWRQLYAQAGQDLWVARDVFDFMPGGYFVDIGAADGVHLSNSCALERYLGWSGLCIEASPVAFSKLSKNRRAVCLNICLDEQPGEVLFAEDRGLYGGILGADTDNPPGSECPDSPPVRLATRVLADILDEQKSPAVIDYLSLDVEGAEERVLKGFPFDRRIFRAATIERPGRSLRELLKSKGYLLVAELPNLDAFYIHESMKDSYLTRVQMKAGLRSRALWSRVIEAGRSVLRSGLRSRLRRW